MTIYILSQDHAETTKWLDDKSLDRQIKDIAQVLCNTHWMQKVDKNTFKIPLLFKNQEKCEWSRWVRECKANYLWMVDLGISLMHEYMYRKKPVVCGHYVVHAIIYRIHNNHEVIYWARDNTPDLPDHLLLTLPAKPANPTPIPPVMPKKYMITRPRQHWPVRTNMTAQLFPIMEIDVFESYRNYYKSKWHIAELAYLRDDKKQWSWTRREKPEFLKVEIL